MIKAFKKYFPGAGNPWDFFNAFVGQVDQNARETDSRLLTLEEPLPTGTAVLVGGTKVVNYPSIRNDSIIILSRQIGGGTLGHLSVSARVEGQTFTILSSSATDTSTIAYLIL